MLILQPTQPALRAFSANGLRFIMISGVKKWFGISIKFLTYSLIFILLIASEKLITLDMNLQFAICNFLDCITKPTVYQRITTKN